MPPRVDPEPEQLVVITGQLPDEAVNRLRERFRVTQSASPRVFLGRGQPDRGWPPPPGVHVFATPDIPDEILRALDRAESLFVAAWRLRMRGPKQRRGDRLDWDAPGFEPPR